MGAKRDDALDNLQPAHIMCNFLKGSKREGEAALARGQIKQFLRARIMRMRLEAISPQSAHEGDGGSSLELGENPCDMGKAEEAKGEWPSISK